MSHGAHTDPSPAGNGTAPLAPSHGSAYRLLQPNEVIEAGDEYLEDDCKTWTPVPIEGGNALWQCWMIGKPQNPMMMVPFRRPTPNDKAQARRTGGVDCK